MRTVLGAGLCSILMMASAADARAQRAGVPAPAEAARRAPPTDESSSDARVTGALIGGGIGLGVGVLIVVALYSSATYEPSASSIEVHGPGGDSNAGLAAGYAQAFVLLLSIPITMGTTGLGALLGGAIASAPSRRDGPKGPPARARSPSLTPVASIAPDGGAYLGARLEL